MQLDCPNGHAAVVRHDPKSTGMLAMCDVCGWSAPKVKADFERAQREEREQRQLKRGQQIEEEEELRELEPAASSRRRADK
jgi:hypothetical protein